MAIYNYKLANGWNNTAGYTNIEDISVSGATPLVGVNFFAQQASTTHFFMNRPSALQSNFNNLWGGTVIENNKTFSWTLPRVTLKALFYLKTTYVLHATHFNRVTVCTITEAETLTYINYNAWLRIPLFNELATTPYIVEGENSVRCYDDVQLLFVVREAI